MRRWAYTTGGLPLPEPVEVGEDWRNHLDVGHKSEAEIYGDVTATDGTTPIDSRRKHREYMKSRGLAMADDFRGVWAKAAEDRKAMLAGGTQAQRRERREDIGRALYQLENKPRRQR